MPDSAEKAFTLLTVEPCPDVALIPDRQMVVLDRAGWLVPPGRNRRCFAYFPRGG